MKKGVSGSSTSKKRSRSRSTKKGKSKKGNKVSSKSPNTKPAVDNRDPAAIDNLNVIAHNVPTALEYRKYRWPKAKGKKK